MSQLEFQLKWPQSERERIGNRVLQDYRAALGDHNRRIDRWREYYRRYRAAVDTPAMGQEDASNVPVPYIRWNVLTKWAKEMDSLFGDDAEIVAVPVGESDYRRDAKIGKYMTWRVLNSMKLTKRFCAFVLRKLIFGRSVAYSPWKRRTFEVLNPQRNYEPEDVVGYDGPDFQPLWPDDFIVPVEEVESLHEFSFVIRRYRARPDDLLRGEREGRFQGIEKNWQSILNLAQRGMQRAWEGEEIKTEKDIAEGLQYTRPLSSGESVMVIEWYGRWRPLKKGPRGGMPDASEWDTEKRELFQQDFVVSYILDLNLVIGIQDLRMLYPTMENRRPFTEAAMMADGTYWSPGLAEMLIELEDELRVNHNLGTEAAQMAANPPIGYRPAAGMTPEEIHIEPGLGIPLDNPQADLVQLKIGANIEVIQWKEQATLAYGEKLTGQGDLQMGRQVDRPNAPRTAAQTQMLIEEGNVRISLDTKVLAEDMSGVLSHIWDLEYIFANPNEFFRVTEDDAAGLFEVQNGGSILTMEERDGRYDFRLKFANSVWSREVKKQQDLALYQLDLQNPLVVQNPRALWEATRRAHAALGDPNLETIVPRPAEPDISIDPKTEWVNLLHGEDVRVNPADNDLAHMTRHMQDLQAAERDAEHADPEAARKMAAHYQQHIAQLHQKKIYQAVVEQATQAAAQLAQSGGPLRMPNGLFGGPPTLPPGNPLATGPYPYSGHPEVMHEQ